MEIKIRKKNKIVILDLYGRIDINSAIFVEVVGECLRSGYYDFICNFEEVEIVEYMGISAILLGYKEVANNNGRMKLVNIPSHLRSVFYLCGVDKVIEIYSTEEAALKSFEEDRIIENIQKMQLRRRFQRLPIDIKAEVKSKLNKKASCIKTDILDLSGVGAYIYGCRDFHLGEEVVVILNLPKRSRPLELDARVVWLSDKEVQQHIHPGMGVEFYNISSNDQQELVNFIERNLARTKEI